MLKKQLLRFTQLPTTNYQLLNQKGYTLIELIIYVAILAFSMLAISTLMIMMVKVNDRAKAESETNQNLRYGLLRVAGAVRNAKDICSPAVNATDSTLVLLKSSSLLTCALAPAADKDTFKVGLSSELLEVTEGTSTAIPLTTTRTKMTASSTSWLSFKTTQNIPVVGPKSVQINMKIEYKGPNAGYTASGQITESIP